MATEYRVTYETRQHGAIGVYQHISVNVWVQDGGANAVRGALDEAYRYFTDTAGLETRFPVTVERVLRERSPERFGGDDR